MNFPQANKLCKKLCRKFGISKPPQIIPLKYSRVGKCVNLGHYDNLNNTIELNIHTMVPWGYGEVKETISHELAHTKCYQLYGSSYDGAHDKWFRGVCKDLGLSKHVAMSTKITTEN